MKQAMAAVCVAAGCGVLFAADFFPNPEDGWQVMPVRVVQDATDVLPESGAWKPGRFAGAVPQAEGAKKGDAYTAEYNCWYKRAFDIPADWKGKDVRLQLNLNALDAVVHVNGKKAGVLHHMQEDLEISGMLACGQPNEIKIFVTNGGFGIGEKPNAYHGRDDGHVDYGHLGVKFYRVHEPPIRLTARTRSWAEAPYANPSWRKRELVVSATVHSLDACEAEFAVEIREDSGVWNGVPANGEIAKTASLKAKLRKGENEVALRIPWADPKTWETVPNAFLYTCKVELKRDGIACDGPDKFLFGFREIWREGKEIMMNGHVQRFRGFWQRGMPKDFNDLHKYGYNLSYETHEYQGNVGEDAEFNEKCSRAGICRFSAMPSLTPIHGWTNLAKDKDCLEQWRRHLAYWARKARNWPCIVAASCGVNQLCPSDNMLPAVLAQRYSGDFNNIVGDINLACAEARKLHPNCLYFSHADGTQEESDLSSSNLYFNFTPLQEREEWLSSWAQKGIRPWYASEFGAPYYACWFHSRVPQMTEWLAVYYGDRAYDEEQEDLLRRLKPFAKDCRRLTHGGWVDGKDLYAFSPLAEEYSRMLVYRTNRAWRGFGQNGGLMYLTSWNWDEANAMRERQRLANGPLVTWLGGAPQFTDRTHAYRAGATIEKQLVFIWDGLGDKTVKAAWRFVEAAGGRLVASGRADVALKQGDIKFEKISGPAPEVKVRTGYRFEVAFEAPGIDDSVKSDAFEVEVHPSTPPTIAASAAKVALYDPEGDSAKVLDSLGVKYATVDGLLAAATNTSFTHLVLGRHALDHAAGLEKYAARVAEGLRILVLQQTAETWQALGFKPEDSMARAMYNVALDGVDNRDLNHWAGSPMGPGAGHTMKHSARRGPRWTHTHAVSSTPFEIPNRAGFTPIVRGEFDNAYTALLEARRGKGSATFCAFDFEGRVGAGGCPAATAVAKATFDRFLGGQAPAARQAHVAGARAKRLAAALGLDAAEYAGGKLENAVLLAGRDSPLDGPALKNALGRNATAVVFGTTNIVAAIGLALDGQAPTNVWRIANRQELGAFAPFAGVGPSLLRWRDEQPVWTLKGGRGWKTACDGVFALAGDGSVLVDMTDPFVLCDRYRDDAGGKVANQAAVGGWGVSPPGEKDLYLRSAAQSEENDLRRWAIVLANLGVGSGEKAFARSLYAKPLVGKGSLGAALAVGTSKAISPSESFHMLGPWPCALDNP